MKMFDYIKYVGKALIAGLVAFAGAASAATADGSGISQNEWWIAIGATVVALGGVFSFSNGPKPQSGATSDVEDFTTE